MTQLDIAFISALLVSLILRSTIGASFLKYLENCIVIQTLGRIELLIREIENKRNNKVLTSQIN